MTGTTELEPLQPIRRFDVLAEIKRLESIAYGDPDDVTKS